MADWAQVALTIGPAGIAGAVGYFVARQQSKATYNQLKLQLDDAREREERQRKRGVRSTPLLVFRAELATMAQKFGNLLWSAAIEQKMLSISKNEPRLAVKLAEKVSSLLASWEKYSDDGSFERAKFQLSDAEIVEKATMISFKYLDLYDKIRTPSLKAEYPNLKLPNTEVTELQELINQRLEAL